MSDLFISPFHPAYRKLDLVSPVTPYQASTKELPFIDWHKQSNQYKVESMTYDNTGRMTTSQSYTLERWV
jgi:hypothetical protein